MRLLFDQNLSPKLPALLDDVFSDSAHVHLLGLGERPDPVIWDFAEENGFVIVTKDSDFADYAATFGFPPHVIQIQTGNCETEVIEQLLRNNEDVVREMLTARAAGMLALY